MTDSNLTLPGAMQGVGAPVSDVRRHVKSGALPVTVNNLMVGGFANCVVTIEMRERPCRSVTSIGYDGQHACRTLMCTRCNSNISPDVAKVCKEQT